MNDFQKAEVLSSPKWVRVYLGNEAVADSRDVKLLRAHGQIAVYYASSNLHLFYALNL